jgi:hypothetical protein
VDHTSDRIVYSWPEIRSGFEILVREYLHKMRREYAYSHVETSSGESACERIHQLPRYSKIAQFHDTFTGQKNIGRLYIPMDRLF